MSLPLLTILLHCNTRAVKINPRSDLWRPSVHLSISFDSIFTKHVPTPPSGSDYCLPLSATTFHHREWTSQSEPLSWFGRGASKARSNFSHEYKFIWDFPYRPSYTRRPPNSGDHWHRFHCTSVLHTKRLLYCGRHSFSTLEPCDSCDWHATSANMYRHRFLIWHFVHTSSTTYHTASDSPSTKDASFYVKCIIKVTVCMLWSCAYIMVSH